jgi:hypothetical protein
VYLWAGRGARQGIKGNVADDAGKSPQPALLVGFGFYMLIVKGSQEREAE